MSNSAAAVGLKGKSITKIADLNKPQAEAIIARAFEFREKHRQGVRKEPLLDGHVVALVFEKPSLRTKVAFEVAACYLGGTPVFLSSSQILASGNNERGRESIPDIARNLERFADLIMARVYKHQVIDEMTKAVRIPVINALCDQHHPTQALADLMTIKLMCPRSASETRVAFVGDGNNVATSLMQLCALFGYHFRIATPAGYELPEAEWEYGRACAAANGSELLCTNRPEEAVEGAHVIYTDTFVSMGQEQEKESRRQLFQDYQVNARLMARAAPQALFMHCLPAHRGEEVTDEVMDSGQSVVFEQAENRLHIAKALLSLLLVE